jgi:hypothetical protein
MNTELTQLNLTSPQNRSAPREVSRARWSVGGLFLAALIVATASGCGTTTTKGNTMNAEQALQEVKDVVRAVIDESFGTTEITVDKAMFGGEPCGSGKEFYLWTANISPTAEPGAQSIDALSKALLAHNFERLKRNEDWVAAINESWGNKTTQISMDITGMRENSRIEIKATTGCVNKTTTTLKP